MSELKSFTDALYLQGKLIGLLGLPPDATAREVEAAVVRLLADRDTLDWLELTASGINWQLNNTNRITRDVLDRARKGGAS